MTERQKRRGLRIRDKAQVAVITREHDESLFVRNLIDRKSNLMQEFKTALRVKETQEQELVRHLTNKQLLVERRLKQV